MCYFPMFMHILVMIQNDELILWIYICYLILTVKNSLSFIRTILRLASLSTSQEYEFGSECSVFVVDKAGTLLSNTSSSSLSESLDPSSMSSSASGWKRRIIIQFFSRKWKKIQQNHSYLFIFNSCSNLRS